MCKLQQLLFELAGSYSMRKKQYWHQTWVSNNAVNLLSSFAKHLQLVTLALMVDFLCHVEQLRKYSQPWYVHDIFIFCLNFGARARITTSLHADKKCVCLIGLFNATSSSGACSEGFAR